VTALDQSQVVDRTVLFTLLALWHRGWEGSRVEEEKEEGCKNEYVRQEKC